MVRVFKHPKDPIVTILYKNRVETFTAWEERTGQHFIDRFPPEEYDNQLEMTRGGGLQEIHFPRHTKSILCRCKSWSTTDLAKEHGWGENDYGKDCKCTVESEDFDETEIAVDEVIAR